MLNQQAQAIAITSDLPLYVRLHWLGIGRVDHVGHVHLMPAEAVELLDVSPSQISRAIRTLVGKRLLWEGSMPTRLLLPRDHIQRKDPSKIAKVWQCPRPEGDPLRTEPLLTPGILALRGVAAP